MRAVVITENGSSDVLKIADIPRPSPAPDEVLFKVEYAGINFIDTYQRTGLYPVKMPFTMGREAAGVIEEIGSQVPPEYDLHMGDKVAVYHVAALAEYTVAPAAALLKLPPGVSTRDGAAIVLQGLTAWTLVKDAHEVKPGETVLVQAAAGGTGGLVVQMAKALGATVIGTVSSQAKAEVAKAHGADYVIIYTHQDLKEEVLKITKGLGCHAVLSGVGKDTAAVDLALTRRKGTFVTFGNSSGAIESVRPLDLSANNVKLVRPTLGNYIATRDEFVTRSTELMDLLSQGKVRITIGGEYRLEEVAKAQDDLVSKKTIGKLIVKVQE